MLFFFISVEFPDEEESIWTNGVGGDDDRAIVPRQDISRVVTQTMATIAAQQATNSKKE